MKEKLLYAIHHCSAIDTDFHVHGTTLIDNEVEDYELEHMDNDEADAEVSDIPPDEQSTGASLFSKLFYLVVHAGLFFLHIVAIVLPLGQTDQTYEWLT
jgi:hypothetical protein